MRLFVLSATSSNPAIPDWIKLLLQFFWVPLIVPVIVFIVKYITKRILIIREIKKGTDKDINSFIELYNNRISQSLRIDVEAILRFVGREQKTDVTHHLLICKHSGKVVGFMKFMVSKPQKCIFIAYIAKDKTDSVANEKAVTKMLLRVMRKYFKHKYADRIITEIEQGDKGEYNTSLAKIISRYAKAFKFTAYFIDVPYIQPKMPGEESFVTSEDLMSLIYVPIKPLDNNVLSKNSLIQLIEFIYFEIYGPSCNEVMCDCISYNKYLGEIIKTYKSDFDDYINLIPLGGN